MKTVIYLEKGQFKIADTQEWNRLVENYKFDAIETAKHIDMDLSLFDAMSGYSFNRHAQNILRELYNGD
jgi:hypothetical protein